MCGIAGMYTPGRAVERTTLDAMVECMRHRGPDGEGIWVDGDVGLGMRRLAIVDVDGGDQPLTNEDRTVTVVFNGEIYNHAALREGLIARGHQLGSHTDGEVIAHLYEEQGDSFVADLDGIFAFALWDARSRKLLLARDPLGVKPLYFARRGTEIRFASELKALLRDPAVRREIDPVSLDLHLTFRFTPAPRTLLQDVEKLEPATLLIASDHGVNRTRYWDPVPNEVSDMPLDDAAHEFRARLRNAVRRQMMSDRPIGAMLSGGIDSAAIVAMMAESSDQVKTFTVGFEGGGDADETALARQTAALFDTDHHELVLPFSDFEQELPRVIEMLEEPVGTSSAIGFREVSRLARPLVPVLLSGQGADEILAGYWRYVGEWIASRTQNVVGALGLTRPLERVSRRVRNARLERGLRALRYPDPLTRFLQIYAVFEPSQKQALYQPELRGLLSSNGAAGPAQAVERYRRRVADRDPLSQMMYVDTRLWLPDDLLLVGDKMSMAESVEMRVPFLDRGLVEFVEALPSGYKLNRGVRKTLEKQALDGVVPSSIINRKERGFLTPVSRWLRDEMHHSASQLLLDPNGVCGRFMERAYVERLLNDHQSGRADYTRQLFCLVSVELWAQRFAG